MWTAREHCVLVEHLDKSNVYCIEKGLFCVCVCVRVGVGAHSYNKL